MTDPASSPLRSLFLNKNLKDLQMSCRDHLFPVETHLSKQLQRGGAWYVRVFCIWSWNICMIKFGILKIWWWWWCKGKHAHVHICSTGGYITLNSDFHQTIMTIVKILHYSLKTTTTLEVKNPLKQNLNRPMYPGLGPVAGNTLSSFRKCRLLKFFEWKLFCEIIMDRHHNV